MFASRIARSVGTAGAGNRLMKEAGEISEKTMLLGAGGLAGLTGLAYWAGYHAEGKSKAGRENVKEMESRAMQQHSVPK